MITASEYRDLPLESLAESANNPRRRFDESALNELAESIRTQGILAPLVVRIRLSNALCSRSAFSDALKL
jgi:ParB family chromosome partitioning protein